MGARSSVDADTCWSLVQQAHEIAAVNAMFGNPKEGDERTVRACFQVDHIEKVVVFVCHFLHDG